jgi:AraC family transcriptional regulator of adaptative response/methylated-DNA-[protein]-cysteine methyltransferase
VNTDYRRVEIAIRYLEDNAAAHPDLEEVADHLGLSKYHFQRLFRRWAGVSPKRFLQLLTVEHAKELLRAGAPVLTTTWETGLSSPGRLHDLFVAVEAMTPGEYGSDGEGLEIAWGVHDSPFGPALLASTERGLCRLRFGSAEELDPEADLAREWPAARIVPDMERTRDQAARLFDPSHRSVSRPLPLVVRGTNFQVQVWRALLTIPEGSVTTYGRLAAALGRPRAARAVGAACGANRIAWAIPCHRVLRESGALGGYAWGTRRKRAMLAWEGARAAEGVRAVNA